MFEANDTDTRYLGEAGRPSWQTASINLHGFGSITDLAQATANDFDLAALVAARASAMTSPKLKTLVAQAGDVLGAWGSTLERTRELTPVLLSADGATLLDRAVWVEDTAGGYFTLKSGAAVLAANGSVIARPGLEQVMTSAVAAGAHWQVEQAWSPTSRGAAAKSSIPISPSAPTTAR